VVLVCAATSLVGAAPPIDSPRRDQQISPRPLLRHGPQEMRDRGADGQRAAGADALREQLPDGAMVLPQLRLTDAQGDREADAVVLWPGVGVP
jgi:hypothetical protein